MASVQAIIASATGYKSGANEVSIMALFENKTIEGLTKWQGFRDDVTQCTYWPGTDIVDCSPVTKWNLKNVVNLSVPALFNKACLQSFGCTTGGCASSCATWDDKAGSFWWDIPVVAENATPPGAVPNLTVTPLSGALNITWGAVPDPSGFSEVFAYRVEIWKGTVRDVPSLVLIGYTEAGLRNVTIGGLTNGQLYTVDVYARSHNNKYSSISSKTATPVGATNPVVFSIITTPETPKAGDTITIKAQIANTGPNGKVRAVFKVDGTQISDQNSTLNTFPGGGMWEPTAPYTMPNKTITITVEAYGWDGSKWVLTDTKSITRTPSVTPCSGVTLTPFSASVKAGEKVTFTATVTPTTEQYDVQFKDRAGTLLGTCKTSGGSCTFVWDSTGKSPGTYYVTAYVVQGGCTSTESIIQVSPEIRQWNVNIYVRDSVTNNPIEGATVTIGTQSKATDTTGFVQFRADEGTIDVTISKTGYNTFTTVELVFSDKTFNYVLSPTGIAKGSIHFVTVPTGADVDLDGNPQGVKTPVTVTDIPAGEHTFTLKLSGYNDLTGSVTVVGGSTVEVYAVLTPSTPGAGSLYINSTPGGADITIDGQPQNIKTPANITNLTAGSHEVKLTKVGYQDLTQTVTITAGTTTYLNVSLTVLPGIGTLEISSTPAGARVFIDGADVQKITPATITNLSSGDHTYKLVLSGYKDATGTFTIEPGKTTVVSVPLTKTEAAVPTTALLLAVGAAAAIAIAAVAAGR